MRRASLLLSCFLVACGGKERPSIDHADAVPPDAPGTAAPTPPAPTAPTLAGNISLLSVGGQFGASAFFALAPSPTEPLGPGCTSRTSSGDASDSASAGDIVVDLERGARSLRLTYDDANHTYDDASLEGIVRAGSAITLHAAGTASVPAFDATAATAAEAHLVQPLDGAALSRDATDLEVAWTPMQEPLFVVSVQIVDTTISCRFDASTGHGVVPSTLIRKAVLAAEATSCTGACTSLSVFTGHTTKVTAGAYDVFVTSGANVSRVLTLAK